MLKIVDIAFDQFDEFTKRYGIEKEDIVYIHFIESTFRIIMIFKENNPMEVTDTLLAYLNKVASHGYREEEVH